MKFVIIPIFCSLLAFTGCNLFSPDEVTERIPGERSSSEPRSTPEYICRYNMFYIANAESMFYGIYNRYTESLDTLEIICGLPPDAKSCPECGWEFLLVCSTPDTYNLTCPLPELPNHGTVIDGVSSWGWINPPYTYENLCHSHMVALATAESMYYGEYNTYTDSYDNLYNSGIYTFSHYLIQCPLSGNVLFLYSPSSEHYSITCPEPYPPYHGSIVDGITSW